MGKMIFSNKTDRTKKRPLMRNGYRIRGRDSICSGVCYLPEKIHHPAAGRLDSVASVTSVLE